MVGSRRWRLALVAVGLSLATAAAYAPARDFGFVSYDDPEYVGENPQVGRGVSLEGVRWALTSVHHGNWHPLTTLSWMLERELFGLEPRVMHRTNVLLHIGSALLLLGLLVSTTGAVWKSAAVAALFALHPLHVESVAWISSRKDVLSALFGFASLLAYVRWVRRPRPAGYALLLLLYALGLMAKPTLVTWPFVLLLLDFWPLGRISSAGAGGVREAAALHAATARRLVLEKLPLLALSGISIALTLWSQRAGGALRSEPLYPLADRLANALVTYVAYLWRAVWPSGLSVLYPYPERLALGPAVASALLLVAISGGCWWLRRPHPHLLVGWLWYLGTLVPMIGIVQVGLQASADRYTYLPLVGIFVAGVWGSAAVAEGRRRLRRAAVIAFAGVILGSTLLTARQVRVWQDSIRLYEHGLRVTGGNPTLSNNLGIALVATGRSEEAIAVYERGLARPSPIAHILHYNAGLALAESGRHEEALVHFGATLRVDGDHHEARFRRARSLETLDRLGEARGELERVVAAVPEESDPHAVLGRVLGKQGDLDGARRQLALAVELSPGNVGARINLAIALLKLGDREAAEHELEAAIERDPDDAAACRYLDHLGRKARDDAARCDTGSFDERSIGSHGRD